jgi:hypothetical protein
MDSPTPSGQLSPCADQLKREQSDKNEPKHAISVDIMVISNTMSEMPPQQYRPSRRSWIKLWVNEWLDGTVRWQLTQQQRSMWADLLAMAGYSRFPGIVTPGNDGQGFIAYPIRHLCNVFGCTAQEVEETLEILEKQERIKRDENGVIYIINWDKYQSEYQEKRQRTRYAKKSSESAANVHSKSAKCPRQEEEVEVDVDREVEVKAEAVSAAFSTINSEPFGPKKFQTIWAQEWSAGGNFADAMERTIQRCSSSKVKVPGRFFSHKHEVEKVEAAQSYKVTPR